MALNISKATCGTQALPYAFMDSFLHIPTEMARSSTSKGSPSSPLHIVG